MKRILAVMALALAPAVGGVVALNTAAVAPAMADTMQKTEARGLFVLPAYEADGFNAKVAMGAPSILVFTKPGCPRCTRQINALQEVLREPAFAGLAVQQVNFTAQADIARQYGVTGQSTIVGFKGGREVNRREGDVTAEAIRAQLSALLR